MKRISTIENLFICIIFIFSLMAIVLLWRSDLTTSAAHTPVAIDGVLDLSDWSFRDDGVVKLDGTWDFYWNKFVSPSDFSKDVPESGKYAMPSLWDARSLGDNNSEENGYATFKLTVHVKDTSTIKCIHIPLIHSAYALWINGNYIASSGIVGTDKSTMKPAWSTKYVDFQSDTNTLEIVLQVSNFNYYHGGIPHSLILGDSAQLRTLQTQRLALDIFLFTGPLLVGIYYMGIFILRRKEIFSLYFSIFCILMSLRPLLYGDGFFYNIFPNVNFEIACKLYIFILLPSQLFLMFIGSLYAEDTSKRIVKISAVVQLTLIVLKWLTDAKTMKYIVPIYELVIILVSCYTLYVVILAVYRKRYVAKTIFSGMLILFIFAINDIFYNSHLIQTGYYTPIGMLIMILAQSLALSMRFTDSFTEVEKLSTRLISLDHLKDEFLAHTSHELRTPLNGIIGIAQSMIDGAAGSLSKLQIANLSLVVSSGKRLNTLVNDILDFSKLKNSDIILQKKAVDIKQIVELVLYILQPLYSEKPITIENEIPDSLLLVYGDENRIQQIMFNLVENALKFTEQGSVKISAAEKGDFIEIFVSDTGIGISEHKLPYIFDSFEQLDASISKKYGGTGLGLNISKQLAILHSGDLQVFSTPTKGTTFVVKLPVFKFPTHANTALKTSAPTNKHFSFKNLLDLKDKDLDIELLNHTLNNRFNSNSNKYKILIVDDEPINIQVLTNLLSVEGYKIDTANNGFDALSKLQKQEKPDLILLDIMMPKLSGYKVCLKIREAFSLYELPIILMTSQNQTNDIIAGFRAGANDYISKPFESNELKARIKMLLELKAKVSYALTAEMCFLQSQIKPHFIYNTLTIIISFCRTDAEKARELLINFSNYLRRSFDFKNLDHFIPLEKELDLVQAYLSIELVRFAEKLNVQYYIDPDIHVKIPPLILQPLVENAVKHGILKKASNGTIKISVKQQDNEILLSVEDDGVGIEQEIIPLLLEDKLENTGIGLSNVHKRIKSTYGYGLYIESTVNKGTKVCIHIPKDNPALL